MNKKKRHLVSNSKQEGLALISIVLFTALVLASIVGITATIALTAKRTTSDQMMALRAHYAAESGLTLARLRLGELEDVVNLARYPNTLTALDDHALDFCGLSSFTDFPGPSSNWTNDQRINGHDICEAQPVDASFSAADRLSILDDYIYQTDMQSIDIAMSPSDYLNELFSTTINSSFILQTGPEGTVKFDIDYNIYPKAVRLLQDALSMRFVFGLEEVVATGTIIAPDGTILASRKLELQPSAPELYLEVSKPSFAQYGYFAETRLAPSGGQIYFKDGNNIGGRVHINYDVGFSAASTTGGPRFTGKFSTTQTSIDWHPNSAIVNEDLMFLGGSEFGANYISLPDNNHIQRDKALGVTGVTTEDDICQALNLAIDTTPEGCQVGASGAEAIIADGIYYAVGDGADQPNSIGSLFTTALASSLGQTNPLFFGGIYVKGDVDNIVFSIENGRQVVLIQHRNGSELKLHKQVGDGWDIEDSEINGGATESLINSFNGLIYVDGKIGCDNRRATSVSGYTDDLRKDIKAHYADGEPMCADAEDGLKGDGTNQADIQEDFMVTVTATGNVNIKEDITYSVISQCASKPEDTFNILGVFTPGGNIKVDGPDNSDLTIHGAYMASKVDHGFGTLDYRTYTRGSNVDIVLHGSVIHHTDQAVGTFNSATGQNVTGYGRDWTFDCRLSNGFAPPFFPTQNEWDKLTSFNGLNNRSTWRLR